MNTCRKKRRGSGIPSASVVAERANTPPGQLGGDLVAWDGDAEEGLSEAGFEGHAFLPAATALCAELTLCADEAEKGMRGHGGGDGEGKGRVERAFGLGAERSVEGEDVGMAKEVGETALERLETSECGERARRDYSLHCPRHRRAQWRFL